ncbi:MAG: response regulator transcription factor [Gammaproteobacteria bacterium]|nr:response regulator transcription factor [Gammaproteobacteria bacterium]
MEMPVASKNVFIVEDSVAVRARLVELVRAIDGATVVGEAGTPVDAVIGIMKTRPDFVVLDFQLEGGTGADVLRMIRPQMPKVVVMVLTNYPLAQIRRACIEAGADTFFDKTSEFGKIKDVIAGTAPG